MNEPDGTEFLRGIEQFNRGEFFECHDTLEAIWAGSGGRERVFLQGLIQTAVGFYHFGNGNPSGALSQWSRGAEKLKPFGPEFRGVRITRLLACVSAWKARAERTLMGARDNDENIELPTIEIINKRRNPWPQ